MSDKKVEVTLHTELQDPIESIDPDADDSLPLPESDDDAQEITS